MFKPGIDSGSVYSPAETVNPVVSFRLNLVDQQVCVFPMVCFYRTLYNKRRAIHRNADVSFPAPGMSIIMTYASVDSQTSVAGRT